MSAPVTVVIGGLHALNVGDHRIDLQHALRRQIRLSVQQIFLPIHQNLAIKLIGCNVFRGIRFLHGIKGMFLYHRLYGISGMQVLGHFPL